VLGSVFSGFLAKKKCSGFQDIFFTDFLATQFIFIF
jgi:hypothetical protein